MSSTDVEMGIGKVGEDEILNDDIADNDDMYLDDEEVDSTYVYVAIFN